MSLYTFVQHHPLRHDETNGCGAVIHVDVRDFGSLSWYQDILLPILVKEMCLVTYQGSMSILVPLGVEAVASRKLSIYQIST